MPKLVLERPGPDAPGYLRRTRRLLEIQEREPSLAGLDEMIEFLLEFITEPVDRAEARELLLDISQKELKKLGGAVVGANTAPLSDQAPSKSLPGGIGGVLGAKAPHEGVILAAAREWGVPPWTIETECSQRWWEWWIADNNARTTASKP